MYYVGVFKNSNKMLLFSDEYYVSAKKYPYFSYMLGPYRDEPEAKLAMRQLRREGYYMSNPSRAKYCRERQLSPGMFDPRSFRTITLGKGKKGVIGCPKRHFHSGKCKVGTRLQTILHLEGSERCPVGAGGRELAKRKRNIFPPLNNPYTKTGLYYPKKGSVEAYEWSERMRQAKGLRHDNPARVISHKQALALTKKVMAYAKKLYKHELAGVKENPGAEYHARKFVHYMRELEKYKIGSQPYIATLAKAYEHLESERATREESYK